VDDGEQLQTAGRGQMMSLPLGSGSKKKHKGEGGELTVGMWNCWGLSKERMDYLFGSADGREAGLYPAVGKGEWIVGLIELHGDEQTIMAAWDSNRFMASAPPPENDPAAGAAIVMSPGLARIREAGGCYPEGTGSRIIWAQFPTKAGIPLIVIFPYIPHFGRANPSADDTYADLAELMKTLPEWSVKVIMGDFNGRLARAYDYTGHKRVIEKDVDVESEVTGCWSVHGSDNAMGKKLRTFLTEHDLVAKSTYFKPARKKAGAGTYEPFGEAYENRKGATIDYGCISKRFSSMATNCRVRWGPSEKRWASAEGRGIKKDHGLLEMQMRVHLAKKKKVVRPNRAALRTAEGATLARDAYVAARAAASQGTIIVDRAKDVDLLRTPGALSFEELGLSVEGCAAGMLQPRPSTEGDTATCAKPPQSATAVLDPDSGLGGVDSAARAALLDTDYRSDIGDPHRLLESTKGSGEDEISSGPEIQRECGDETLRRGPNVPLRAAISGPSATDSEGTTASAGLDGGEGTALSELGTEPQQEGALAATYGVEAMVAVLEKACKAGMAALPPAEKSTEKRSYSTSERTRQVMWRQQQRVGEIARLGVSQDKREAAAERRAYGRETADNCRQDKREWLEDIAKKMEAAFESGDAKEMSRQHKRVTKGKGPTRGTPTLDKDGNRFQNMDEVLQWWHSEMSDHWKATDAELGRPELESLVRGVREKDIDLSNGRLDRVMRRLKEDKAVGDDEIPVEFYEAVMEARMDLYDIVRRVFSDEEILANMVVVLSLNFLC
jgi:hypothetical protein